MVQNWEDESKKEKNISSNLDLEKIKDEYASSSDDIALLAARAYLQRKHKVEWHQKQTRKRKQMNSLGIAEHSDESDGQATNLWNFRPAATDSNINQGGVGYFWEDPTELKYLRTGRARLEFDGIISDGLDGELLKEIDDQHENCETVIGLDEVEEVDDSPDSDFEDEGIFTSFPQTPPSQFERKSLARKKLFQDSDWKAKWYKARWSQKASLSDNELKQEKRRKRIEKLIQDIPSQFFESLQLDALTDEEIEDAIRIYILTNQRKSRSMSRSYEVKRKLTQLKNNKVKIQTKAEEDIEHPPKGIKDENNPFVTPFMISSATDEDESKRLLEAKRNRSERAKKAYESRLANMNSKQLSIHSHKTEVSVKSLHLTSSLKNAGERIEAAVACGDFPDIKDIKILLRPQRVPGRKQLLLRVLNESLGLRGRCVPTFEGCDNDLEKFYSNATVVDSQTCSMNFATSSSLKELGMFILYKLQN